MINYTTNLFFFFIALVSFMKIKYHKVFSFVDKFKLNDNYQMTKILKLLLLSVSVLLSV